MCKAAFSAVHSGHCLKNCIGTEHSVIVSRKKIELKHDQASSLRKIDLVTNCKGG